MDGFRGFRELAMDWDVASGDIEKPAAFRVQDGKVIFRFRCPRCLTLQDVEVDLEELLVCGVRVTCKNQPGCGNPPRNMNFRITVAVEGSYNGYSDDPYRTHEDILM